MQAESLAVKAYQELRLAILNRDLTPGERLKPAELATTMGVSLGVVREAMSLLAAKNLVEVHRNRAFHVTTLSMEDLANLTYARIVNEGAALRLAVERGGVTWESEVLAAHHRMASLPMFAPGSDAHINPEWAKAHIAFHRKLIDACGNPILLDICDRLSDAAELYRAWSGARGREAGRDVAAEHRGLCDAVLAHDADRAVTLFEEHVTRTQSLLSESGLAVAPVHA